MDSWTPAEWASFLTALGGFVTLLGSVITTIVLQIKNNARSKENGEKLNAVAAQTNNIADAVPGASTAPTDHIVKGS